MKILIVSYFYPPYNNIGALRVGKLAEYWIKTGHDVRVVTAADQPTPPTLAATIPAEFVTYTPWINVNWLPELALGGRERVGKRGFSTGRSLLGKLGHLYKTLFNFPDGQIGWWPFGLRAAEKKIREGWRPELIYASAKPSAPLLIAGKLSAKYGIPWVAEFRDLWADDHNYGFPEFRRRLERAMERRILAGASALVTVSEPLADRLRTRYTQPVAVVMNGFDPADYACAPVEPAYPAETLNIVYTGMIYSGKQDISTLFSALAKLSDRCGIHLYFYGRYLQEVARLATEHNVAHLVSVSPAIPHKQAVEKQMQADVLLLLLWNDPTEKGILTGKLFEYLGARHPILAIGAHQDAACELIQQRKAGIVSDDPCQIAEQLEKWAKSKASGGGGFVLPEDVSAGLTRQEQFAQLDVFLKANNLLPAPLLRPSVRTPQ